MYIQENESNLGQQKLLQLHAAQRELKQENFQLRQELSRLRADLKFNFHRVDLNDEEQIKYVLTHSSMHIERREAEVKFLEGPKRLILYGKAFSLKKPNLKEFYTFSYSIDLKDLKDEFQDNPIFIVTETKIEIIFNKKQENNKTC